MPIRVSHPPLSGSLSVCVAMSSQSHLPNKKGEDTRRHTDECASRTGTLPHRDTHGTPAHRRQNDT